MDEFDELLQKVEKKTPLPPKDFQKWVKEALK